MTARIQVIVEAKDASSGVLRGITSQLGDMGNLINELTAKNVSWGNVAEQVTTMVINGLKDSYNAAQEYSQAVRDLALVSGVGAEESSRLLQVLDDFQVSADDVTAATRIMTKNGLTPTVETLAQLSDEYLSINDAQERNKFILDNLGRSGLQWVNVLNQGGDALRSNSNAINQNLILTDQQVKEMELARLAQDEWNDTIEGTKIAIGAWMGAQVAANKEHEIAISILKENGVAVGRGVENTQAYADALVLAKEQLYAETAAVDENTAAIEANAINYQKLIGDITGAQNAIDRYTETQSELQGQEAELIVTREALLLELDKTEKAYGKNSKAAQDLRGKIDGIDKDLGENAASLKKNAEEYERWAAQTVFAFAQARAAADGSISTLEGEVLIQAGQALGLFDQKTAEAMQNVNESFDNLDTSNAQAVIENLKAQLYELTSQVYTVTIVTNTDGVHISLGDAYDDAGWVPGQQTGGVVYAGNPYNVGEGGAEPFFPKTDGRILGHAESLHALTLGGGGGGTNYFYGNVELTIGSDDAAGFMEIR